jgi:SAM-dependent methyltransferase
MGVDRHFFKYLQGLPVPTCASVLMLGRQNVSGYNDKWAETVLSRELDTPSIYSLDQSNYEAPSFIHDLNLPVPDDLRNRFDLIIDGGTLEHVFNIPQALANVSLMLKQGGVFVSQQMCGITGHGFYTLSPELFFSWAINSGYQQPRCVAYRHKLFDAWHELEWDRQSRIEIQELGPFYFIFSAIKGANQPMEYPIQSQPNLAGRALFWLWFTKLWSRRRVNR